MLLIVCPLENVRKGALKLAPMLELLVHSLHGRKREGGQFVILV
jgi:hypothetical protein